MLTKDRVVRGLGDELDNFEQLVRSLSHEDMAVPSRCEGWTVGDVAAHVIGGMADIANGRLEGLGTPEVTQRQVDERKGRTASELADELAGVTKQSADLLAVFDDEAWNGPSPGGFDFSLGEGVEALWYDAYLHGDDIRAALGRPSVAGPGVEASVSHITDVLTRNGWGPATVALDGLPEFTIGTPGPGDRRIEGDPLTFIHVGTGRKDPGVLGLDPKVNIYAE